MERLMFNTYDFFDPDELKAIAEDEIRKAFRNQLRKESDIERVITNLSSEYIHSLVDEVYGKSFDDLLRQKVREAIENGVNSGYCTCDVNISEIPTADVSPVVRCKDCSVPHNSFTGCPIWGGCVTKPDDFCSYGKRLENKT